jgi:hypothetical protein
MRTAIRVAYHEAMIDLARGITDGRLRSHDR